jgi:hypothetical protein
MTKAERKTAHAAKMKARRTEQRARICGWLYMCPPTDPRRAPAFSKMRAGVFYPA